MVTKDDIIGVLNPRLSRLLQLAEAALPESQYRAFRKLALDEFGNSGFGKDLALFLDSRKRQESLGTGRPIQAGKGVDRV